jgi:hypothetical protein
MPWLAGKLNLHLSLLTLLGSFAFPSPEWTDSDIPTNGTLGGLVHALACGPEIRVRTFFVR